MARRTLPQKSRDWLFPDAPQTEWMDQSSLLDVVDSVLNKGVVLNGDVILGVANVDLIYAKLSVLLGALDRVMDYESTHKRRSRKQDRPRRRRRLSKKK
jgi:gas vesicle structural protein